MWKNENCKTCVVLGDRAGKTGSKYPFGGVKWKCPYVGFQNEGLNALRLLLLTLSLFLILGLIYQNLFRFTFGPQHPAAHGVLCCLIYFIGEHIQFIDINIGYLHRGTEKLSEFKTIEQCIPYFDRLDYVSVVNNEHLLVNAVENLMRVNLTMRSSWIRMIMLEITRMFNGMLCVTCMLMDLGCLSPLLWAFEERDKVCLFFDLSCGTRMHLAFMVIMGVLDDIALNMLDFVYSVLVSSLFTVEIFEQLVINNRLFYMRLRGLALLDVYDISFLGCSGVLSRSVGVCWDCRLYVSYELYFILNFDFIFSACGDAFDRMYIRIFEMRMALIIVKQLLQHLQTAALSVFSYFTPDMSIETIIMLFYSV